MALPCTTLREILQLRAAVVAGVRQTPRELEGAAASALTPLLADEDIGVRRAAAECFGLLPMAEAAPPCVRALAARDAAERSAAAVRLGIIRCER